MELGKWATNEPTLLQGIASSSPLEVDIKLDDVVSTLGLRWLPSTDCFVFKVSSQSPDAEITKRSILSEIARLYDPLDWLAPTLVTAKIIQIPQWIGASKTDEWHLHRFAGASKRAYAAAVYAIVPGSQATLLMAKTKVAPTKVQTLPRLELCGCTFLVRLANHLLSNFRH